MLRVYQILTRIAGPVIDLYLLRRRSIGKEDPVRFRERLGHASSPRPNGRLIWIHAASIGESLSVLPLINELSRQYKDINILLTTGTMSSAKLIESRLPDKTFHQYVPIDKMIAVRRFLGHWKPDLALWVESELWPNLVTETSHHCPMVLLNGRMSDSSYSKWQKYKSLGQQVLSRFSLCLPQSQHDAERFKELGAKNVKYIGNLKFNAPALPADPKKMGEMITAVGDRHVWLMASTHSGEEKIACDVHVSLQKKYPDLLTIIVPRHPNRADNIIKELSVNKVSIAQRSKGDKIERGTNIYLADTMGEMGLFYRLAPIVFIGGSLVEHGGQNLLEAARLDCAIIFGPYMDNFKEIKQEFEKNHAAVKISSEDELKNVLDELISNNDEQAELAEAALKVVEEKGNILDLFIKELKTYIEGN